MVEIGVPRIAVDLLGGDEAPAVVVDGALQACSVDPDLHLLLVGPRPETAEIMSVLDDHCRSRVSTLDVDGVAGMADPPVLAVRRHTTVFAAVNALVAGTAQAVVTAGASGAAVTAAAHGLGRFPGLRRPALATTLPSLAGPVVLLDVGASTDASVSDLLWHAVLGAAYAGLVEGVDIPRVALLSIGSEPGKGDRLRRETGARLGTLPLPAAGRYVGLIEGYDVARGGPADVVVTDGFTGNVLLKGIEGAYALAAGGGPVPFGVPRAAALLGVGGTVVVCHGSATAPDLAAGIALAARLYRLQVSATLAAVARELPVEAR
ncbi:MAG: phosphate acyltransferase PlsX [Dactylosporangium sp.]|nr:phosphate acyltransferase PlsX [Dactylosporangium sp.]NNJ63333.1 phosphate acyltransferase PlsX [Dactylosporangium sp.]